MKKCINCKKNYEIFMLSNFNLGLCKECHEQFEKEHKIGRDDNIDTVVHNVICPECGKKYKKMPVDIKCVTKGCNVWFFWDELDCVVFAKWLEV
jgi:predicted amidophosphoribosyltransferase